jgi:orotate phosphoribosyltransferase
MNFDARKQAYVQGLLETNAFIVKSIKEEPFTLRSGRQSYMFTDHSKIATSPTAYKAWVDAMQALLQETYADQEIILCNVDSKISAQLVGAVAYNLALPQIIYKSKALTAIEKGTAQQLTGNKDWNIPVAILDDVASGKDGTAKDVGDLVREAFPKVENIQIFVGFIRDVRHTTYKTNYILTRDELLAIVWDKLSADQQKAVEKERAGL